MQGLRHNKIVYFLIGVMRRMQFEVKLGILTLAYRLGIDHEHDGLRLPPPRLRFRVHGDMAANTFIDRGSTICDDIVRLSSNWELLPESWRSYLDFGCGCGRVARHLVKENLRCQYTGVDIDAQAIAWMNTNMEGTGTWI